MCYAIVWIAFYRGMVVKGIIAWFGRFVGFFVAGGVREGLGSSDEMCSRGT